MLSIIIHYPIPYWWGLPTRDPSPSSPLRQPHLRASVYAPLHLPAALRLPPLLAIIYVLANPSQVLTIHRPSSRQHSSPQRSSARTTSGYQEYTLLYLCPCVFGAPRLFLPPRIVAKLTPQALSLPTLKNCAGSWLTGGPSIHFVPDERDWPATLLTKLETLGSHPKTLYATML